MKKINLDPFQKEAIFHARNNNSVIVSAPTGAGKTLIAEHIIESSIKANKGIIYTAPIKALSNQKFRDFCKKYPSQTGILTGDVSINRNAKILIMTTEIFRNAILVNPQEFEDRQWVIFDEIHYLDDIERGTVWEETIILLPPQIKILALSATISNIHEFAGWLNTVHSFPVKIVIEKIRPVPLHFFFQCNNSLFPDFDALRHSSFLSRKLEKPSYQEKYFLSQPNRVKDLLNDIKKLNAHPCVYFSFSRRRCEEMANETSHLSLLTSEEQTAIIKILQALAKKFDISDSQHASFLFPLIKRGIAYHHAGLLPTVKEIIERLFATGLIKLIFTTETFALGINMPAKAVVFDTLSKFYGKYHGYLKTRDFYQMAGRAGRRSIDKEGFVFTRINPSHIDLPSLEDIICGKYEPIKSQLNSCYATILNLYKIMGETIYNIYPKSFHSHQSKNWEKKETLNLLKRKISLLKDLNYITSQGISTKARLAAKVYSFELSIGEMFENGYLDSLDELSLFTLITALVYEPRKGERRPKLNKKIKLIVKEANRFSRNIHRKEKDFRIFPASKKMFFHLSYVAEAWFNGFNFLHLSKISNIDEGEIVRYFRMSIQVFRELSSSNEINSSLKIKIINCLKKVNRGIIDAEKQLRQKP